MAKIKDKAMYDATMARIEELLPLELNQANLSALLGVSPLRVSDYLTGRSVPTLRVARKISSELKIDANVVLGCSLFSASRCGNKKKSRPPLLPFFEGMERSKLF